MHTTTPEALALQVATLQAQLSALAARDATIYAGDRVTFQFGADRGVWLYATVTALTMRHGEPCAVLAVAGAGQHLHVEPLDALRRVCGACPDCQALNARPGCVA
ncbi:hypothetical protein [Sphaerotilus mobilis]|uniref:Uncharacterized protein n=1 Tax=Sphaerotilus mobilis TaxID=47994 RepID=A0A4Q7LQS8_9BURK|nr:hypothetical protein [Sphaerotilus mobilis]RZS56711.1 hypothetical protein EV685_1265 [Sphaerotilus mobilis]